MVKCPRCGTEIHTPIKEWNYSAFHVGSFDCKKCERSFKAYFHKGQLSHMIARTYIDYTLPILESLIDMGGGGRKSDVLDKVFNKVKDRLGPKDFEKLPSGTFIRWKNKAQCERQTLKNKGYLKKDSQRGVWEITDEGRKFYERLKRR